MFGSGLLSKITSSNTTHIRWNIDNDNYFLFELFKVEVVTLTEAEKEKKKGKRKDEEREVDINYLEDYF